MDRRQTHKKQGGVLRKKTYKIRNVNTAKFANSRIIIHTSIKFSQYRTYRIDASRLALGTQGWSHRTSQEGSWLLVGQKSNTIQQEVRAEFIEDIEKADTDGVSGDSERKGAQVLSLFRVQGFLLRMMVWCKRLLRHPGGQNEGPGVIPWSRGTLASRYLVPVVWNRHMIDFAGHFHLVLLRCYLFQRNHQVLVPSKEA